MTTNFPQQIKVAMEKRILNEFGSKILNEERIEQVAKMQERASHRQPFSDTTFHCECDDQACGETISLSVEMYARLHKKTKQFIVVPSHVRLDIEDITDRLPSYVVVEKHFPHSKTVID